MRFTAAEVITVFMHTDIFTTSATAGVTTIAIIAAIAAVIISASALFFIRTVIHCTNARRNVPITGPTKARKYLRGIPATTLVKAIKAVIPAKAGEVPLKGIPARGIPAREMMTIRAGAKATKVTTRARARARAGNKPR